MRYLFITGQLNAGGAERVLLDVLRHFDYSQHEVDLCQIVEGGTLIGEVPSEVDRIALWRDYTLGYKIACRFSRCLRMDFLIRERMRKKLPGRYDVVISFLEGIPLRFHAIGYPEASRHVTWVHANLLDNPYESCQFRNEEEERASYARMHRIVCVSKSAQDAFCSRFPELKHTACTIENPIVLERVLQMANVEEVPESDIVVVGRLNQTKGVDRAVQALQILQQRGRPCTLTVVGDGPQRSELENLASRAGVESQIRFIGYTANPYPYMRRAKVLLCPSRSESFCLAICEALALGVPVVATPTTGAQELLLENQYGLLSDHDPESIAEAIECLLSDSSLMAMYQKRGPARAAEYDVANTMKAIYCL